MCISPGHGEAWERRENCMGSPKEAGVRWRREYRTDVSNTSSGGACRTVLSEQWEALTGFSSKCRAEMCTVGRSLWLLYGNRWKEWNPVRRCRMAGAWTTGLEVEGSRTQCHQDASWASGMCIWECSRVLHGDSDRNGLLFCSSLSTGPFLHQSSDEAKAASSSIFTASALYVNRQNVERVAMLEQSAGPPLHDRGPGGLFIQKAELQLELLILLTEPLCL